jgi:K+-transporting ATPase ATPase C chain
MLNLIYRSTLVTLILAVVLCGFYPAAVWVVGRVLFPSTTRGGLVTRNNSVVGANLIGQNFSRPEYFHGRPSAAGEKGYDAAASSGSNLGPTSKKLIKAISDNVASVLAENPGLKSGQVPVDLVTASASGLDPHISPAAATVQVTRVANARKVNVAEVEALLNKSIEARQLGFLGEPVVNVLRLNLALDEIAPLPR